MSGDDASNTGLLGVAENVRVAIGISWIAHSVSEIQTTSGFVSAMLK